MNNQVKLIYQTKLLEWLEDQKENSTMLYESIILSKIERAVLDGKFDTPPVPTIKPGDKVRHSDLGEAVALGSGEEIVGIATDHGNYDVFVKDLEVVE